MYKIDYHVHTVYSPDGENSFEDMLKAAGKAGIDEIIFTDHVECNLNESIPPEFDRWPEFDDSDYVKTLNRLSIDGFQRLNPENSEPKKNGYIKYGVGIELGQATQNPKKADEILNFYDWDYVLGSLHNLRGGYDFYYLYRMGTEIKPLMKDYFEQLYELCVDNKFSVLSHLYYPVKYIYNQGDNIDISRYKAEISDIFKVIIHNGKGIEINTSAVGLSYNDTNPNLEIIKLYRQMGGEIITVGSDSHGKENIGKGFSLAEEYLRRAGFRFLTVFRKQRPVFVDIS